MAKKICITTWLCLIIISICVGIYYLSPKNKERKTDENIMYEGTPEIEFVCYSIDEFIEKINIGDIRSINQNSLKNWTDEAKDLYSKWYDNGAVPSFNKLDDSQLYSYNYTDEIIGISFIDNFENSNSYYDIILIGEQTQYSTNDIEEYYLNYDKNQDENLKSVGGGYRLIDINGEKIKAAIAEYDDGSLSIDFIWNKKYWIRMWDTVINLYNVLQDFEIVETPVSKPQKFDNNDFNAEIKHPNIKSYELFDKNDNNMNQSAINYDTQNYNSIVENFNSNIPKIEISKEINDEYELIGMHYKNEDMSFVQYDFCNKENDNIISVSLTPDIYLSENVKKNPETYIRKIQENNPCRFDKDLFDEYGVSVIASNYSLADYSLILDNLPSDVDLALEYYNEEYNYGEYIIFSCGRFIRVSSYGKTEALKEFIKYVSIK